ncbi:hypothetical protein LPTSP3_g27750 [Leptospira kobayashii]|uniref:Uncharacterized protein n=1 Tax=Leptospira kobayashii TaxID=1917830 RepID=A0ABM7ULJ8_9LEPT|nr:hypothetical protein [Leptospira kobayashii]BDA79845.1 hypothetical protein LPTSP3_g27750 [Leptospira kobayashii]
MQGFPRENPDTKNVESLQEDSVQWIELSERLLRKVQELECLMEEVRSDMEAYRAAREEWHIWHQEWKKVREVG